MRRRASPTLRLEVLNGNGEIGAAGLWAEALGRRRLRSGVEWAMPIVRLHHHPDPDPAGDDRGRGSAACWASAGRYRRGPRWGRCRRHHRERTPGLLNGRGPPTPIDEGEVRGTDRSHRRGLCGAGHRCRPGLARAFVVRWVSVIRCAWRCCGRGIPIFEPGLERLVAKGHRGRLLSFHEDNHEAVRGRSSFPHPAHALPPRRERRHFVHRVGDRTAGRASRRPGCHGAQVHRAGRLHSAIPGHARPGPAGDPGGEQPRVPA